MCATWALAVVTDFAFFEYLGQRLSALAFTLALLPAEPPAHLADSLGAMPEAVEAALKLNGFEAATLSGDVAQTKIKVTDNRGVTVTCPKTTLAPGESMTCTAAGTAVAGEYCNIGTAVLTPAGGEALEGSDQACYTGARIAIESARPSPRACSGFTSVGMSCRTSAADTAVDPVTVMMRAVAVTAVPATMAARERVTTETERTNASGSSPVSRQSTMASLMFSIGGASPANNN